MKKFLILLSILCFGAYADTINLHWLNEDGSTYQNSTCTVDGDLNIPTTPPTKYGYTFTGWKMVNYIPIEYLESTGTQYIDTEFKPNLDSGMNIKFYSVGSDIAKIAAVKDNDNSFGVYAYQEPIEPFIIINGRNNYGYDKFWIVDNIYGSGTGRYRVIIDKKNMRIIASDGSAQEKTIDNDAYINNYSMFLFALNDKGTVFASKVRIYSCKLYNNDVLVRDFIPVLDEDGVPCMFDKVEAKFYYNQGTGQFIAGPALTE